MPPLYSNLFACLYNEPKPIGSLGRGTHYSIFRSVEWLDVTRKALINPEIHDFAIIWDEDHDVRVIEATERIYMAGLLSPIQFIGERKGMLTVIVAAKFYWCGSDDDLKAYTRKIEVISQGLIKGIGDSWPSEIGCFDRSPGNPHQNFAKGIIADEEYRVATYLANIDSLWQLGTKPYVPKVSEYAVLPPMRMSDRIEEFVRAWVLENVHNVPGLKDIGDEVSRLSAKLIADARARGFSEKDLSKEVGDIEDFLTPEYENVHDPDAGGFR